jgi:hypothetical protein
MNFMLRGFVWVSLGLLLGLGRIAYAADSDESKPWTSLDNLVIKGFGSLGLARSDVDSAEYVRDLSQPRGLRRQWSSKIDSVLGVQANLAFDDQTEGVVQLISRYRYDGSHEPEVSWAFLRHEFLPDVQMRFGRLGTEFYMLADSRLIGYANTWVRPPADFYGPLVFSHLDGVDATIGGSLGDGLVRVKLFGGRSPEKTPFFDTVTWDLRGSRLIGGHVDYFEGPWQFRIGRSAVKFSGNELPLVALAGFDVIQLVPELSSVHKTSRFDSLGAIYDQGPLRIQAMLGRIQHETASYEDSRAAFIVGSYRIGEFTPYVGFSKTRSKASNISTLVGVPEIDAMVRSLPSATHMDQHTYTLGARWDFRQNWALKVQFDSIHGAPDSVFLFRGPMPQWGGRMKVLSATLDFAF